MAVTASGHGLHDAARLASESVVVSRAVALGRWMGSGRRPVTAGQVLRKADVPTAGAALGVDVPPRLRTMADIRALHRPWCVAVATGLLQIDGGWVTGGKQYADAFTGLERTGDEGAVRIRDVLAPGGKIGYTYDFGADWEHEITLEQTLPRDAGQDCPVCVEWRGDSPVEYWSEDDPEEPLPFDVAAVNRELVALGGAEV